MEVDAIPRKASNNSKGINFFTEVKEKKWITRLTREVRFAHDEQERARKTTSTKFSKPNRKKK